MLFSSVAAVAAVVAVASAQAQTNVTSGGYDNTNINYPFVLTQAQIATYNISQTSPWCEAQRNTCPQICGGQAYPNTCDPTSMRWQCKCTVGTTPNVTQYIQTIPFFMCQEYKKFCVASYTDAYNQQQCNNIACGSIDASKLVGSFSSSAAAASSAAIAAGTGAATASVTGAASSAASGASSAASAGSSAARTVTSVVASAASSAAAAATSSVRAAGVKAMEFSTVTFGAGLLAFLGLAL